MSENLTDIAEVRLFQSAIGRGNFWTHTDTWLALSNVGDPGTFEDAASTGWELSDDGYSRAKIYWDTGGYISHSGGYGRRNGEQVNFGPMDNSVVVRALIIVNDGSFESGDKLIYKIIDDVAVSSGQSLNIDVGALQPVVA